jgi:hypothetical protein
METKRWYVREIQIVRRFWEYEVEAETMEEAEKKLKDDNCTVFYPEYSESISPIEVDLIEEMLE